ncbi:hypothetical protein DVH05_002738 [Phytophthora capsici]|nr:hypothetical protein DVH05_002738 [Phytophthora capsici]
MMTEITATWPLSCVNWSTVTYKSYRRFPHLLILKTSPTSLTQSVHDWEVMKSLSPLLKVFLLPMLKLFARRMPTNGEKQFALKSIHM